MTAPTMNKDECTAQSFESFLVERDELVGIIHKLPAEPENDDLLERARSIVGKYQEQPELLDPHLASLVTPVMEQLRGAFDSPQQYHRLCKFIYTFCKVRGYKTVLKFFPHAVSDFERTLALLEAQRGDDAGTWETRYVLLLWLSVLFMLPFDLSSLDSALSVPEDDKTAPQQSVVQRVVALCKAFLSSPGITSTAAGLLLARLLTRPDMQDPHLGDFFNWCSSEIRSDDAFLVSGCMVALALIFKTGKRDELARHVGKVFDAAMESCSGERPLASHRHLSVKLVQRLALVYLPPRVAAWRYHRGNRTLLENLGSVGTANASAEPSAAASRDADDVDFDIPEEVEAIVEPLLSGLRDRETIVRWSAAKGIGRVTARLPADLADDIVESVLELFAEHETDSAWHGGCLALAELARRGLLLPVRLGSVVPVVLRAMRYDVRRGACSVGAHVRDAACYVAWAFARAYEPGVMQTHVHDLARGLLVLACTDREVNCRRAASAAFQENVGRQGTFPHGIDILTVADFFALGQRAHAYLEVTPFVAKFDTYRSALVDALVDSKISHWDKAIRALAAEALARLVSVDPGLFQTSVLGRLVAGCTSFDLTTRHGSALGVAQVVKALADHARLASSGNSEQGLPAAVPHAISNADLATKVVALVPTIEKARLYRGKGGEIMREGVCALVEATAVAGLALDSTVITKLQQSIDDNLRHPKEEIQQCAIQALRIFAARYYARHSHAVQTRVVDRYIDVLRTDPSPAMRRGFSLGLGALPACVIAPTASDIVSVLCDTLTTLEEDPEVRDAETRRNAAVALGWLMEGAGIAADNGVAERDAQSSAAMPPPNSLAHSIAVQAFEALLQGMTDYATDNRGDVGSWVRLASMAALEKLLFALERAGVCKEEIARRGVAQVLKQLNERIDRVRAAAGGTLVRLLAPGGLSAVPHADELRSMIHAVESENRGWGLARFTFPHTVNALSLPAYRRAAIEGLLMATGCLTEATQTASAGALRAWLARAPASATLAVGADILDVMDSNVRTDRITVATLKTVHSLLQDGAIGVLAESSEWLTGLVRATKREMLKCKSVPKLHECARLLVHILQHDQHACKLALQSLLTMLCHRFPKVREDTAEKLYIEILTHENIVADPVAREEIETILSTNSWVANGQLAHLKAERDRLYPLFGVEKPVPKTKPSADEDTAREVPGAEGLDADVLAALQAS